MVHDDKIQINIKGTGIWRVFDVHNESNNQAVDAAELMLEVTVKEKPKGTVIRDQPTDILGDMDNDGANLPPDPEMDTPVSKPKQITYKNSNSDVSELDKNTERKLLDAFDKLNKDFEFVDQMLIPVIPNTDPEILKLEI